MVLTADKREIHGLSTNDLHAIVKNTARPRFTHRAVEALHVRNGFSKSRISETNFTSLAFHYDAKMLHADARGCGSQIASQ